LYPFSEDTLSKNRSHYLIQKTLISGAECRWLALTLSFGTGLMGAYLGFDFTPTTNACGIGAGGDC
jgi:hypothetical protein